MTAAQTAPAPSLVTLPNRPLRVAILGVTGAVGQELLTLLWPDAPPSERVSPEVALASIWRLSCEVWALSGRPWPDYTRATMPGRVIRNRPVPSGETVE